MGLILLLGNGTSALADVFFDCPLVQKETEVNVLLMVRLLQIVTAVVMLVVALKWATGDAASYQAWLAALGFVLALFQLIEKRLCE